MDCKVLTCPHCDTTIYVEAMMCGIFRCGISKDSGHQINPHTPKEDCERMIREKLIWGCGKPFRIDGELFVKCDYI